MLDRAAVTGESWQLDGLDGGCKDCNSETVICGQGNRVMVGIAHNDSCPAYNGRTPWGFAS